MHGWDAQIGTDVGRDWGVFFEVVGAYGAHCGGCAEQFNDLYVLGGFRWSLRPSTRLSLFAQTAAGGLHSRGGGVEAWSEPGENVNYFVVQPGGGLTAMVTRRIGIRTQFDVPIALSNGGDYWLSTFPRVVVGTVFRLGAAD